MLLALSVINYLHSNNDRNLVKNRDSKIIITAAFIVITGQLGICSEIFLGRPALRAQLAHSQSFPGAGPKVSLRVKDASQIPLSQREMWCQSRQHTRV